MNGNIVAQALLGITNLIGLIIGIWVLIFILSIITEVPIPVN